MRNYGIQFDGTTLDGITTTSFYFSIYGFSLYDNFYEPRITTPTTVTSSMFSDRTTSGANAKTYGYLELENSDGALDYMADYAFEGKQAIVSFYLDDGTGVGYVTTVIDSIELSITKVVINLRDIIADLDKPLLTSVYGGTNILPNGIDGTDDIKGQTIPRLLGFVKSIEPVQVNTAVWIYQISDSAGTIQNVYDKGVVLPPQSPPFSSVAAMVAGSVTPGSYRVYRGPEGLFFKLGVAPNGIVTCDATGYVDVNPVLINVVLFTYQINTYNGTVKNVYDNGVELTLQTPAFSSVTDLNTGSVTAGSYRVYDGPEGLYFRLGSAPTGSVICNVGGAGTVGEAISNILTYGSFTEFFTGSLPVYEAGIYIKDSSSYRSLVTDLAGSVGSWFGSSDWSATSIDGGVFNGTTGTLVGILDSNNIIDIERVRTRDTGNGVPIWKINLNYQKIDRVLTATDLASTVLSADKNYLAKEYRTVFSENPSIKTIYPNSEELTINTLLNDSADAVLETARLLTLYGQKRVAYIVTIRELFDIEILSMYRIGAVVILQLDRFGLNAGKEFSIIGVETDYYSRVAKLTLWG